MDKVSYACLHEVFFIPKEGQFGPKLLASGDGSSKPIPMYLEDQFLVATLPGGTVAHIPLIQVRCLIKSK